MNFLRLKGLSWQFGVLMTSILMLSMIASTWMEYQNSTQTTEKTLNARIQSIGQLLADISIEPMLVSDFVTINDYLQNAVEQQDIIYSILQGKNNNVIVRHIDRNSPLIRDIKRKIYNDSINSLIKVLKASPNILSRQFPIVLDKQTIGTLSLGLDRRPYDEKASFQLWKNILLTIVTGLFAGFAIYLLFNRHVLIPIKHLSRAAADVSSFKLDNKITVKGHNELSGLAISFNHMTEHLATAIRGRDRAMAELTQLNESLEERIQQRTQELQRLNQQANHLALHDPLTGLPNRTLIMERLHSALQQAQQKKHIVAVFMLDLNRFKDINDTLGHPMGDQLLQEVSSRISSALRKNDTVGRLGGDEFVVILTKTSLTQAQSVAKKISRKLRAATFIKGYSLSIDASIGISFFPDHSKDADTLIQRADVAMYVAKRKINQHIAVYNETEDRHTLSRLLLNTNLKDAISNNQLFLLYQPQVNLHTGKVCGVEALCRWQHPEQGLISSDIFISIAEKSGLIKQLTDWVLKTIVQQQATWQAEGLNLTTSINLSIVSLLDPELPKRFKNLTRNYAIPTRLIKFEITESTIMSDPDKVIKTLLDPAFQGVQCSIDDFGTGYSSLNQLKRLPVNEMKIDKSFVIDMINDEDDTSIVKSTIQLAHSLGLSVVAEGVENNKTSQQLIALGCDIAQGFYYAKPMPADQMGRAIHDIEKNHINAEEKKQLAPQHEITKPEPMSAN